MKAAAVLACFALPGFALPCLAQVPPGIAEAQVQRLTEHWRWMQYWQGSTELGEKYQPGTQATLLIFWPRQSNYTALGFCSHELRVCQMYLNPAGDFGLKELQMFPIEEPRQGFSRFIDEALAPEASPPKPKETDFETGMATLTLPPLDPPPGIAERKPASRDRIEALAQLFACSLEKPDCKNHVLIPFFGEADFVVPVYSECARNCTASDVPAVTFFEWKAVLGGGNAGAWWRAKPFPETTPAEVTRLRAKIQQALMTELPK